MGSHTPEITLFSFWFFKAGRIHPFPSLNPGIDGPMPLVIPSYSAGISAFTTVISVYCRTPRTHPIEHAPASSYTVNKSFIHPPGATCI